MAKRRKKKRFMTRRQRAKIKAAAALAAMVLVALLLIIGVVKLIAGPISPKNTQDDGGEQMVGLAVQETTKGHIEPVEISLLATGDNLVHNRVYERAYNEATDTYDFNYMFEPIRELTESADIAVINQETMFVADREQISNYPAFGTPMEMGDAIINAGFDVVLGATNHTYDKRNYGVQSMLDYWSDKEPLLLGLNKTPEDYNKINYVESKGVKLAMFNYTYGTNGITVPDDLRYTVNTLEDEDKLLEDIQTAEKEADMTICFLHIGTEYQYTPSAYQVEVIEHCIDSGADLIICAHPHVVEPYGKVTTDAGNSAVVYYSCGNLLSAQDRPERLLGGLADVKIVKDDHGTRVSEYNFIPVVTWFTDDKERVYLLDDYTDTLAAQHKHAASYPEMAQASYFRNLWNKIVGEPGQEQEMCDCGVRIAKSNGA